MKSESRIRVEYRPLPARRASSAIVQLGAPHSLEPVVWTREHLASLNTIIDDIATQEVESVVLLGSAHSFGVGADISTLRNARTVAEADAIGAEGWRAFRKLAELDVPSFALITGFALGGALELALFADYRIARSDTRAIGLPEVRLGLVPGWGGIHQLARIAGPRVAYELVVRESRRGANLTAEEALRLGLIDDLLPPKDWADRWPVLVSERLSTHYAGRRSRKLSDKEYAAQLEAVHRDFERSRPSVSDATATAVRLLDSARFENIDEAQRATTAAFTELLLSDAGKASLYAYNLTRGKDRIPTDVALGSARPIKRAAVIGAGLMAVQLATLLVRHGRIPVVLTDLDQARAERGVKLVRANLADAARAGELSDSESVRLSALVSSSSTPGAIAGADFVIEAIFEDLAAKRLALAEAEKYLAPDALLATNTSSLSISAMAEELAHPQRVIGFHVFNPVESVPLVEIIRGRETDAATVATALALAERLKRRTIVSADTPGFVVNRLLARLYEEVLAAIDAGGDPLVIDHSIDHLGLPMTPLRLLDFVGPAVQLHVNETMHAAFPERFARPVWLSRVVASGQQKVLCADYTLTAEAADLLPARLSSTSNRIRAEVVRTRITNALADEVAIMLTEGVVERPEDIDKAMLLGANFPWALGGITPYLKSTIPTFADTESALR